jgi:hypothetical protein
LFQVGNTLIHESKRVRAEVDVETGFIQRVELSGVDGSQSIMTLEFLDLEGPFGDELFERPEPSADARDISSGMRARLRSLPALRKECFTVVDRRLGVGELSWDEACQADLRRFFTALYRPVLDSSLAPWTDGVHKSITYLATQMSDRLGAGESPAELAEIVRGQRQDLVNSIRDTRAELLAGQMNGPTPEHPSKYWADIRALEDEALLQLYDEGPAALLIESFDAETSAALGN